jgi:hypothetical protein
VTAYIIDKITIRLYVQRNSIVDSNLVYGAGVKHTDLQSCPSFCVSPMRVQLLVVVKWLAHTLLLFYIDPFAQVRL